MSFCDVIAKQMAARQKELKDRNKVRLAKLAGVDPEKYTPESLLDYMVNIKGWNREAMMAEMDNPLTTDAGAQARMDASEKVADRAMANVKSMATPEGVQHAWNVVRQKAGELVEKAINNIPQYMNQATRSFMENVSGAKEKILLGKTVGGRDVYAGAIEGFRLRQERDDLLNDSEFKSATGGMTSEQVGHAAHIAGYLRKSIREGNVAARLKEARESIQNDISKGENMFRKNWLPVLDAFENAWKSQSFKKFANRYFENLDVDAKALAEAGVLRETVTADGKVLPATSGDYYHNVVALEAYRDGWDKAIYGNPKDFSDFSESKKYKDGFDFVVKGKTLPATMDFFEIAEAYQKNIAKSLRFRYTEEFLRSNGKYDMNYATKMKVSEHADKEMPAVVTRDPTKPTWNEPEGYKDLGTVHRMFRDIYAHPEFYKWMNAVYGDGPKLNGALLFAKRTSDFLKGVILSSGFGKFSFHGMSLARKTMYQAATKGVQNWWELNSIQGEGLNALSKHDPRVLSLIDHGLSFHTQDMMRNPIMTNSYIHETGEKPALAKVGDAITKFTNWSHGELFQKWHAGLKAGLGVRLTETQWFKEMAQKDGLDYAYSTVAKLMNNTMGGQNLELMGRSKGMQALMQAAFLAPDWQESKFRRLMGASLSDNPHLRDSYRGALAAELVAVGMTSIIAQQVWWAITGEKKKGMEDIFNSWAKGDMGIINIGKTKEGKDINMRLFGSEVEDIRPITNVFKSYYEAISGKTVDGLKSDLGKLPWYEKFYKPLTHDIGKELRYKSSPGAKFVIDNMMPPHPSGKPTPFDVPVLPIALQQAIYAARGGYGDDADSRALYTGLTMASSFAGMPLETKSEPAEYKVIKVKPKNLSLVKDEKKKKD